MPATKAITACRTSSEALASRRKKPRKELHAIHAGRDPMDSSRKRHTCAVLLVLLGLLPGCSSSSAQPAQSPRQQPAGAVNPITVDSTEEQIRQAVGTARVGRKL